MRYSYSKFFDKDTDTVFLLLDAFWKVLVEINKDADNLRFPRRVQVMKACGLSRRNAYKHINKLMQYDVFIEKGGCFMPASFLFEINGRPFNPCSILMEPSLPPSVAPDHIIRIQPKIRTRILIKLLEQVMLPSGKRLRDQVLISFDHKERSTFAQDYQYSQFPRTLRLFEGWSQPNPEIAKEEADLMELLAPAQDPWNHNTMLQLSPNDKSPFFELDSSTASYVLAGWANRRLGDELHGAPFDETESHVAMEYYSGGKNLLKSSPMEWKNGNSLISQLLIIGTRSMPQGNLLGWYDFKTAHLPGKWVHTHFLVSFLRFDCPEKTRYVRIATGENGYCGIISIIPFQQFPVSFIARRALHPGDFFQEKLALVWSESVPEFKNASILKKLNRHLHDACKSYGEAKEKHLVQALGELDRLSEKIRNACKIGMRKKAISEPLIRMVDSCCAGRLVLSLAMHHKSTQIKSRISSKLVHEFRLLQTLIPFLIQNNLYPECVPLLLLTHARQFRDGRQLLVSQMKIPIMRTIIDNTLFALDKIPDADFRLDAYRLMVRLELDLCEQAVITGQPTPIKPIQRLCTSISKLYFDLARHLSRLPTAKDPLISNKGAYYTNQSLYYRLLSVIFHARLLARSTGGEDLAGLVKELEGFEQQLF